MSTDTVMSAEEFAFRRGVKERGGEYDAKNDIVFYPIDAQKPSAPSISTHGGVVVKTTVAPLPDLTRNIVPFRKE